MNTRKKMYQTNTKIRKYLESNGFSNLHFFPHLRYIKDFNLDNIGFDAIGTKEGDKRLYLFQFKTNCKPSKKILIDYKRITKKYYCVPMWISCFDRKGVVAYG